MTLRWELVENGASHGTPTGRENGRHYDVIVMGSHGRRGSAADAGQHRRAAVRHAPAGWSSTGSRRADTPPGQAGRRRA
jgi:hypothetical protein